MIFGGNNPRPTNLPTANPTPNLPVVGETPPEEGWTVEQAKGLVARDGLKAHLGEKVDYNPEAGGTWRIFYYDNEDQGNGKGYFGDDVGTVYLKRDYVTRSTGLDSSYNPTDSGNIMKQMNPKWAKSSYSTIDKPNEHCVAWLCDPSIWMNYKVEGVAKYAIGSPSVEMYMKAFNVYKDDNTALINKIGSEFGYAVGAQGAYSGTGGTTIRGSIEEGPNNIFMTSENHNWWLASPSVKGTVLYVREVSIYIDSNTTSSIYGVCPVVSLN